MLTRNHQLSDQQLIELDGLCSDCKSHDGNTVATYKHLLGQERPRLCNMLYYRQAHLVGFLSTFFFYEDACEIAVMVKPSFRRQGITTFMIHEILPLIHTEGIKNLIFSAPHDVNNTWFVAKGFRYLHCEYQMQREEKKPVHITNASCLIRLATAEDVPVLCLIDSTCFSTPQLDSPTHFQNLLYDPNYKLFIAEVDGVPIGKAHLDLQPDGARVTDIAVLPTFQGRGIGSTMLAHCINHSLAVNQTTLSLNVETNNQQALKIYTRLGFVISNAYDFWTIPIEVLRFAKH